MRLLLLLLLLSSQMSLFGQEEELPLIPNGPLLTSEDAKKAGMRSPEEIQFWRALTNSSTAPSFVVVTIKMPKGQRTICTEAPFLLGAIHTEFGIPYTKEGRSLAISTALQRRASILSLQKREAIRNIPILYNEADLRWAEKALSEFSNLQILNWAKEHPSETLEEFLSKQAPRSQQRMSYAIAHVLFLRGLNVGRGCISSALWYCE